MNSLEDLFPNASDFDLSDNIFEGMNSQSWMGFVHGTIMKHWHLLSPPERLLVAIQADEWARFEY